MSNEDCVAVGLNRRSGLAEVWLWRGGHGVNLTSRDRAPESPEMALAWAKRYAARAGLPVREYAYGRRRPNP